MLEIYLRSVKSVFINKARAFLTFFSIAVGVCAVIVTWNIASLGGMALTNEIDGLGMDGLSVTVSDGNAPLTTRELDEIKSNSAVASAMPLVFESSEIYLKNEKKQVYIWGVDNNADKSISVKLLKGRFFNSGDISGKTRVCIIDEKFSKEYHASVGRSLTIKSGENTGKYRIIGIVKTGSGLLQNVMGSFIPDFIYIPYSTMQGNLASNNFSQVVIKLKSGSEPQKSGKDILRKIEHLTNFRNGYRIDDLSRQKESLDNILLIFTLVLSAVGGISLVVAGINTMNIMLVTVKEKTREIGIKKALGASTGSIITEFLIVSAFISLFGYIIGLAAGMLISFFISSYFGASLIIDINACIIIAGITIISGTLFGLYPAMKAASLDPVKAFRYF